MNGLVEQPNRTIADVVRAKLTNAGLHDKFWCFVAEDTAFKLRRTYHTATGTTPYYSWFNKVPEYTDMRIFGSHVYVVDTDVTRQKLDAKTFLGYFLKFASTTRVVVYYNPTTNKIGRSAHVYFDELNVGLKSDHIYYQKLMKMLQLNSMIIKSSEFHILDPSPPRLFSENNYQHNH